MAVNTYYNPVSDAFGPDYGAAGNTLLGLSQFLNQRQLGNQALALERLKSDREAASEGFAQVLAIQREQRAAQQDQFNNTLQMLKMAAETEMQRQQMQAVQLQIERSRYEFDEAKKSAEASKKLQPMLAELGLHVSSRDPLNALDTWNKIVKDPNYSDAKDIQPVVNEVTQKMGAMTIMTESGPKTLSELGGMLSLTDSQDQVRALRAVLQLSNTSMVKRDKDGNVVSTSDEFFNKLASVGAMTNPKDEVQRQKILNLVRENPRVLSATEQQRFEQMNAQLDSAFSTKMAELVQMGDIGGLEDLKDNMATSKEILFQTMHYADGYSPLRSSARLTIGSDGLDALQKRIEKYHASAIESVYALGVRDADKESLRKLSQKGFLGKAWDVLNPFSAVLAPGASDIEQFIKERGGADITQSRPTGAGPLASVLGAGAFEGAGGAAGGRIAGDLAMAIRGPGPVGSTALTKGLGLAGRLGVKAASKGAVIGAGITAARAIYDVNEIMSRKQTVDYSFGQLKAAIARLANPAAATPQDLVNMDMAMNELNTELERLGYSPLRMWDIFDRSHVRMLQMYARRNSQTGAASTSLESSGTFGPATLSPAPSFSSTGSGGPPGGVPVGQ